jgi:hypothetical protein
MQPHVFKLEAASKAARLKVRPARRPKPVEMPCSTDVVRVLIRQAADALAANLSCAASSTATARSRETVGKSSRNSSSEEKPSK